MEGFALVSQINQLVPTVFRVLAPSYIALAFQIGQEAGQAGLVLRDALGQRRLADVLLNPQAAHHLKHPEGDAGIESFQQPLHGPSRSHTGL